MKHQGVFIGRFQGLTINHVKVIEMMARNHSKNYIVLVRGRKSSTNKHLNPFPERIQIRMLEKTIPSNIEIIVTDTTDLEIVLSNLKEKHFILYSGPDRLKDYQRYSQYMTKKGYHIKVVDTGQLIPRQDNISGTKFREVVKNNDTNTFKEIAPTQIWSMFDELRQYI